MNNLVYLQHKITVMKHFLTLLGLLIMVCSCSKDEAEQEYVVPARRTVIVYMAGENSLSYALQEDLVEMTKGRKLVGKDEDLVVFVDQASSTEKPYIARITNNGEIKKLYEYPTDFYCSDADNFNEVLSRCIQLCPATEDYGLVLWGHASGCMIEKDSVDNSTYNARRAYGVDNGNNIASNDGKWINIPSIRETFSSLGIKWKFILFDCCNMMNIETIYELKDYADFMIGSPAEIPGKGAPYNTIIPTLYLRTDDFYKNIVDTYSSSYQNRVVLSAVNTSKINELSSITKQYLPQINEYVKSTSLYDHIYYHAIKVNGTRRAILHDMREVAYKALSPNDYNNWINAFNNVVVYTYYSPIWITNGTVYFDFEMSEEYWGGISMFFPMSKYGSDENSPNLTIKKMGWYYAVGWSELGW